MEKDNLKLDTNGGIIQGPTVGGDQSVDTDTLGTLKNTGTHIVSKEYAPLGTGDVHFTFGENVTLIFQGGKIVKGSANSLTIEGNNTVIQAPITQIFGSDVKVTGTWIIDRAYPQWFDDMAGKQSWLTKEPHDCAPAIMAAAQMKQLGEVFLPRGNYFVAQPIVLQNGIQIIGEAQSKTNGASTTEANKNLFMQASFIIPFVGLDNGTITDGFIQSCTIVVGGTTTGLEIKRTFSFDLPIFLINTRIEFKADRLNSTFDKLIDVESAKPCGLLKNITIDNSYYQRSGNSNITDNAKRIEAWKTLSLKPACLVSGSWSFENLAINNFLNAIIWNKTYTDSRKITHCQLEVSDALKQNLTKPFYLVDIQGNGDGMQISQLTTDWNVDTATADSATIVHNYRALRVEQCHGGSITDCILNTDVQFNGTTDLVFSGNHLEAGAQVNIVNSNIALRNNWFEKGKRPSIVFDVKEDTVAPDNEGTECFSQVQMSGNTFYVYIPTATPEGKNTDSERTPAEYISPYDIALCKLWNMPYAIDMVENYRMISYMYRSNQPTGLLICTFDADPDSALTPFTDFNDHSYFLSTQCTILRKGKIIANRHYNEIPTLSITLQTNEQVSLPKSIMEQNRTSWPDCYQGQLILDSERKIASSTFDFTMGDYSTEGTKEYGNLIALSWDANYEESSGILRIVRKPSMISTAAFDYVEIPLAGARFIYDNFVTVNGYKWIAGNDTEEFPASPSASVTAVEFHNSSVRAWGNSMPSTAGWKINDIVFNNGTARTPVLWSFNGTAWTAR